MSEVEPKEDRLWKYILIICWNCLACVVVVIFTGWGMATELPSTITYFSGSPNPWVSALAPFALVCLCIFSVLNILRLTTISLPDDKVPSKKRSGMLKTVGLYCPACTSGIAHENCERGMCMCYKTIHQGILDPKQLNLKDEFGNRKLPTPPSLWCQKCDKSFWTCPVTGRCEFCGGALSPERNMVLVASKRGNKRQ